VECLHTPRIFGNCWQEFIYSSIRVPILEFDLQVYNALHNLGVVPDGPNDEVPELLPLEGYAPGKGRLRPVFPPYAREQIEDELEIHGDSWENYENKYV
jgi:hypothetical protein